MVELGDCVWEMLGEALNADVEEVWHAVLDNNKGTHSMFLVDFETGTLDEYQSIEVDLGNDLVIFVTVDIEFDIDYNCNNPKYDDSGCYHDYKPSSVIIKEWKWR